MIEEERNPERRIHEIEEFLPKYGYKENIPLICLPSAQGIQFLNKSLRRISNLHIEYSPNSMLPLPELCILLICPRTICLHIYNTSEQTLFKQQKLKMNNDCNKYILNNIYTRDAETNTLVLGTWNGYVLFWEWNKGIKTNNNSNNNNNNNSSDFYPFICPRGGSGSKILQIVCLEGGRLLVRTRRNITIYSGVQYNKTHSQGTYAGSRIFTFSATLFDGGSPLILYIYQRVLWVDGGRGQISTQLDYSLRELSTLSPNYTYTNNTYSKYIPSLLGGENNQVLINTMHNQWTIFLINHHLQLIQGKSFSGINALPFARNFILSIDLHNIYILDAQHCSTLVRREVLHLDAFDSSLEDQLCNYIEDSYTSIELVTLFH